MKHSGCAVVLTVVFGCAVFGQTASIDYLGQKPPGATPEKFAPELFKINEWGPVFSPDGTELFYTWQNPNGNHDYHIYYMNKVAGVWSKPVQAPFTDKKGRPDIEPNFTPDGKKLYFDSERDGGFGKADIWYVEKTATGWSEAINAGEVINTRFNDNMPSFAPDGTMYFCSDRNNAEWDIDIYYAKPNDGNFRNPIKIDTINTRGWDAHPTVLGDKLFFTSTRSEGVGKGDIYFSVISADTYGKPQSMPSGINSVRSEWGLVLSPDRNYLFFFRQGDGLYWVDVNAFSGLGPK